MCSPCDILDLTDRGLQLQPPTPLKVGDTVNVEFRLSSDNTIRCTVHIVYAEGLRAGGQMMKIIQHDRQHLLQFLSGNRPSPLAT